MNLRPPPSRWIAVVLLLPACAPADPSGDPASRAPDFSLDLLEIEGPTTDPGSAGGVSWVDFDGDGDLDLYVTNGYDVSATEPAPQRNLLYRNDGGGAFTPVTEGVLVEAEAYSSGHTWGDYDNDGDLDVFVTSQRDENNHLYRNDGNGEFTRIEEEPPVQDGGHSYAAGWVDVDVDGWLDLFVANGGLSHAGPNGLYRGTDEGHFEKLAEGEIVTDVASTCGFAWGDYDDDGDPDLFVANHGFDPRANGNALYRNDGAWSFTKILDSPATTDHQPSCAVDWVDVDNDRDLDLYVTNLYGLANRLYVNDGKGALELVEDSRLSLDGGYSFEANWGDFDNDADLDVVIANWGSSADLYRNDGRGGFALSRVGDLGDRLHHTGTMACGDFDADGDVDVYIANWPNEPGPDERNRLYRNQGGEGHWLHVDLLGRTSNRSALGARVRVTCRPAGKPVTQTREVTSHTGFRGQSAMAPHFGLGSAARVDTLEVRWPSGQVSRLHDVAVDQRIEIVEPSGEN